MARLGQIVSAETRKKISLTLTGRKASEETKAKLRNKPYNPIAAAKISAAHLGTKHNKGPLTFDMRVKMLMRNAYPEPNTGCWLWSGATLGKTGYGHLGKKLNGHALVHRAFYSIFKGEVGKMHVLHSCDVPSCVNPDHLFLGTHADNMRDMVLKGRSKKRFKK